MSEHWIRTLHGNDKLWLINVTNANSMLRDTVPFKCKALCAILYCNLKKYKPDRELPHRTVIKL